MCHLEQDLDTASEVQSSEGEAHTEQSGFGEQQSHSGTSWQAWEASRTGQSGGTEDQVLTLGSHPILLTVYISLLVSETEWLKQWKGRVSQFWRLELYGTVSVPSEGSVGRGQGCFRLVSLAERWPYFCLHGVLPVWLYVSKIPLVIRTQVVYD